MRGFAGATLVAVLAALTLLGLGLCLVVIPGRTTRFLNEAFVVVPVVDGRRHRLKRAGALVIGSLMVLWGFRFAHNVLLSSGILWSHVSTST
ncbi:hypothetical protein [Streptomyces sp. NPDC088733]|uniref:hypothetical protein n=1 Tax=Streptomyces sp. NPDC088733 TaxID=3365880 RepID=UPI003803C308